MPKYFPTIILLLLACPAVLLADTRKVPATVDIQVEIRKNQDSMVDEYVEYFKNYSNSILRGVRNSNRGKRDAIDQLYLKVYNIHIPPGAPDSAVSADELRNLTDGKLYAETWAALIASSPFETSAYYLKELKPILDDPRTDRGAILRIGKDAGKEWETYRTYSARAFADKAAQITKDFEGKLPALAREHSDLRAALVSMVGPIEPDDFDRNFQKYIALAQSKLEPVGASTPAPGPAETAESKAGQKPSAMETPAAAGSADSPDARLDGLDAKLKQQKQTLDAVKAQAQTLDDNYPILHHELGAEIEKLSSEIFWMRLILVLVGAGVLVGIGISLLALDRVGDPSEKKSKFKSKGEHRMLREEPLKAILGRIYKMEEEITQLRGELQGDEEFTSGSHKSEEDV